MASKKVTTKVKKNNTNAATESIPQVVHVVETKEEQRTTGSRAKVGHFVAAIVCTVLSMVAAAIAIWISLRYLNTTTDNAEGAVRLIVFLLFGLGVAAFLPALILSITGVACSAIAVKSNRTAIKTISIIFLILSILTLTLVVFIPVLLPLFIA